MSERVQILDERPTDAAAIHALTARAFAAVSYSDGSEPTVIDRLRDAGALAVSLVALRGRDLAGHVAFSKATGGTGDGGCWYALGPISVEPSLQRGGIGSALISAGLERLRRAGAAGVMLVGDPAYYARFGFVTAPECTPPGQPSEYFQMLPLAAKRPTTGLDFHGAFRPDA